MYMFLLSTLKYKTMVSYFLGGQIPMWSALFEPGLLFFLDQRPILSLIITWSLINFSGMKILYYLRISFTRGKHETTIFGIFQ